MKRKLSLLLAMVLAMTMVMGMCVNAYAYEKTVNPETGEGAPVDTGIIDITEDSGCQINFVPEAQPYECMYIDDVERIPLFQAPTTCGATGLRNLADLNTLAGALFNMYGITDEVKPKLRMVCKWIPDGKIIQVYYYMYSASYYEEHYGNTGSSEKESSSPAHVHNFKWQTITAPTKEADGLEGEMCSCGATRNTQPLSAYVYALNEYATPMINAAKSGQTITFEFGEWNSFPKSFMAKLVDKSAQNVTFVFKYKWNHKLQTITIPAGTPIDLNFDWYGPAKMAELYGAN